MLAVAHELILRAAYLLAHVSAVHRGHVAMLNQARLLQDLFLKELGRDLTVPNEHNAFWWTGVKQNMYDGEFRFKMPWVWAERVWDGLSKGVWGARVHWRKYASKWLPHGLWARP